MVTITPLGESVGTDVAPAVTVGASVDTDEATEPPGEVPSGNTAFVVTGKPLAPSYAVAQPVSKTTRKTTTVIGCNLAAGLLITQGFNRLQAGRPVCRVDTKKKTHGR